MELEEKVTSLEAEKKHQEQIIQHLNAEKIALDQMLVSTLKEALESKKTIILKNDQMNQLQNEIVLLKQDKEILNKRNQFLQDELAPHVK